MTVYSTRASGARIRFTLAVVGLVGLFCLAWSVWPAEPAGAAPAAAPPAGGPSADEVMENVHGNLAKMGEAVGGLSKEQQAKLVALEKTIAAKVKADPAVAEAPSFRPDVIRQFRDILTPDQQGKLDKLMGHSDALRAGLQTGNRLKQIGLAAILYANDHGGKLPPDLGSLVSKDFPPENFLAGGSKTEVPKGLATQDPKKQAGWVNQHSDFVYLGAGKETGKVPTTFVLAYPKAPGEEAPFLLADGSVQTYKGEQAAKVVAELKAGTNPPKSMPK